MREVCPGPGYNKICTRRFDIGIGVAGDDIEVRCVISCIVAYYEVTTRVYVHSTVVAGCHVIIDAVSSAGDMNASSITASHAVTLAGVALNRTKIIDYDSIGRIS